MRPLIIMHGANIDWRHTIIRMLMYLAGVAVLALGMSLQTASGLGVAALTCFATTLSMLTGKTLGFWITATYVAYIAAQLAILQREFQPRILLELCFSTLIGGFTDFFMAVNPLHPTALPAQVATMLLSLAVTAFGVSLVVNMGVVPNAPDGLVQVIAEKLYLPVSAMKYFMKKRQEKEAGESRAAFPNASGNARFAPTQPAAKAKGKTPMAFGGAPVNAQNNAFSMEEETFDEMVEPPVEPPYPEDY